MNSSPSSKKSTNGFLLNNKIEQPCSHPRVQVVAREEDAEFVECLECREVFDSSEFKDMAIEESSSEEA